MLGVLGFEERTLMMVEPPGEPKGIRILEIHDGIFVAVEDAVFERLRGLVRHAGETKVRVRMDALAVETRKDGCGRRAVETFVVEADLDSHLTLSANIPVTMKSARRGKPTKMAARRAKVKHCDGNFPTE